jgi:hypothetical protein
MEDAHHVLQSMLFADALDRMIPGAEPDDGATPDSLQCQDRGFGSDVVLEIRSSIQRQSALGSARQATKFAIRARSALQETKRRDLNPSYANTHQTRLAVRKMDAAMTYLTTSLPRGPLAVPG